MITEKSLNLPEPAPWAKHADFVCLVQGDGASATLLRGWGALCRYFAGCHYHRPDAEQWIECMARLTDWEEWSNAGDGFPYWLCCDYEDGSVSVIRLTNASPEDGASDAWNDAITALRRHAGAECAARGIATDYVRHVQEAADWLAGDAP